MANLANLTIPITKRAQQPDGSVIIEGPITDDSLDLDRQIVDAASAAKALQNWFDEYANVRQQHSPILAPAGKGISLKFVDGVPWLKAHILEPTAVKLVNARVYQAYSIGIGDGRLDTSPAARKRAPEGVLYPTLVNEVSVVDYPANVHMGKFMIAKRKDGAVRDVAKVKVAKSLRGLEGDSLVEALKSVHAGEIVHTASSEKEANELIGAQFSPSDYEADGNVIRAKRQMDPNVGGGVDRDKIPGKDFAGKNRSFPIVTPGDVSDAASSIGRAGPDNYTPDKLKARIIAIAQRKGPEFVSELPKKWRSEMGKAKAKKAPGSKKPFPGAAPPFKGKGDETATDDTATTKPPKKNKKGTKATKGEIPEVDQKVTEDLEETHTALTQAQAGPTQEQIAAAQYALNTAQLNLQSAQQSQANTVSQDQLSVQQAEQALASAQSAYTSAVQQLNADSAVATPSASGAPVATPNPTKIAQDQAAVAQAAQAIQTAQLGVQSAQQKAASAEQQAATQVASAQNALSAAQNTYTTNTTPSQTAIQSAQQAVVTAQQNLTANQDRLAAAKTQQGDSLAQARQSLASAETNAASSTGPQSAATIASDEAAVSSAKQNLSNAQTTAAHTTLTAPADGQIVAVNVEPGTIAPTGWAITMQSTALEATASFAETSVVGLKVGQPASVTVTAPDVTVPGTVSSIQPVGTSSGSNSVVTFTVTVSLGDPPATVLSGMSASVAVTTAQAQNVVTVPAIAVIGSSGNYEVRVLDSAGKEQAVPVQVGLMSTSLAQIESGINAGETVVIGTVSALNSSTTTSGGFGGIGGIGGGFRPADRTTTGGGTRTTTGGAGAGGAGQP